MNAFFSVFRRSDGGAFKYSFGQSTLAAEESTAREMDGCVHFGEFLYSRSVRQAHLDVQKLYRLKVSDAQLRYQELNEAIAAPFDYVGLTGAHRDELWLPLSLPATVDGLGVKTRVQLHALLRGARTFKFKDLTEKYLFGFKVDREVSLLGFKHAYADYPEVEIPLSLAATTSH